MNYPQVILFTGAGANCPLGLPTTRQFFEKIDDNEIRITDKELFDQFKNLTPYVTDIEQIWYLCDKIVEYNTELLDSNLFLNYFHFSIGNEKKSWAYFYTKLVKLKTQIEDNIFKQYCLPVQKEKDAIALYQPLIDRIFDKNKRLTEGRTKIEVPIFTTNYDRVIDVVFEKHFASNGWRFIDGFKHPSPGSRQFFMDKNKIKDLNRTINEPNIKLFQLHGSLSWKEKKTNGVSNAENIIIQKGPYETKDTPKTHGKPFLIYPGTKKTNTDFPFNKLYGYFKEYLINTRQCIIIGCSLRDENINKIFIEALKNNPKLKIILISGKKTKENLLNVMENEENEFYRAKQYYNKKRIIPVNERFGEFDPLLD